MNRKEQYWQEFIKQKKYWPHGFTLKRLEKIKPIVWKDKFFWDDILLRHGGNNRSPEELKKENYEFYQHCLGNMSGMLGSIMYENGIIK